MSVINNNLLLTAAAAGGYQVSRSLRFSSGDSAYLSKTYSTSPSDNKKITISMWVKRAKLDSSNTWYTLFWGYNGSSAYESMIIFKNDTLYIRHGGSTQVELQTTAVYRDTSAWYHIVLAIDTTQATSTNRTKLYVNGSQVTTFSTANYPAQNSTLQFLYPNANNGIGAANQYGGYFDGYIAECHVIDGLQLDPSSFAETDATTGQWIPKLYSGGSYGTNGFKLTFADNSAATAAALGKDTSGNSPANNWTPTNFTANASNNNTLSSSSHSGYTQMDPYNNFVDGNDSTVYRVIADSSNATTTASFTFGTTLSGTLEVLYANGNDQVTGRISINGGSSFTALATTGSPAWISVGTISGNNVQIRATFNYGGGSTASFYGIRVNGVNVVTAADFASIDSLVDTPTSYGTSTGVGGEVRGNYATLNPLDQLSSPTLANGNLDLSMSTAAYGKTRSTIGFDAGTTTGYYAEITITGSATDNTGFGVIDSSALTNEQGNIGAKLLGSRGAGGGNKWWTYNGTSVGSDTGVSHAQNQVIGIAVKNGKVYFAINNTWVLSGNPSTESNPAFSGLTGTLFLYFVCYQSNAITFNAGQRAFAYTAPSGFAPLVDTLLPSPVIAKPSTVFDIVTRNGGGTTQTFTTLRPGLLWEKRRDSASNHYLYDRIRGDGAYISSNLTNAEAVATGQVVFNTNGYTVTSGFDWPSTATVVDWVWDAGTSTVTNNNGSISSQVRANASAGFSIVTYTGNNTSGATVGHGLGVAPSLIICKRRENNAAGVSRWQTYHKSIGPTNVVWLDTTDAAYSSSSPWNNTAPSSTVFTLGSDPPGNPNGDKVVAYCWAPVAGYSAMGSYSAGSEPFIYLGFKPAFLMVKCSTSAENWNIFDNRRSASGSNVIGYSLQPNLSNAEYQSEPGIDFLSNGFKLKGSVNTAGQTYIYFAVAESPFQYARAR